MKLDMLNLLSNNEKERDGGKNRRRLSSHQLQPPLVLTSMSKGLSKEDTAQEHALQAVVLCESWGEQARWGPLVRRKQTDDEEFDESDVGGEQRPWVRTAFTGAFYRNEREDEASFRLNLEEAMGGL
jgi:hypothetical protein